MTYEFNEYGYFIQENKMPKGEYRYFVIFSGNEKWSYKPMEYGYMFDTMIIDHNQDPKTRYRTSSTYIEFENKQEAIKSIYEHIHRMLVIDGFVRE